MPKASQQWGGSQDAESNAGSEPGLSCSPVLPALLTRSHPSSPQALSVWGVKCLLFAVGLCLNEAGGS